MNGIAASIRERFHEPAHDPPEPWEQLTETEGGGRRSWGLAAHPYVPPRWADVPPGAADALAAACGAWRLDQLFVVPAAGRRLAGDSDSWVTTPDQVLALTHEGVALWVDAAPVGEVVAVIALDELVAFDHIQIQHYARLTLCGHRRRLAIRYHAVARHELDSELSELRAAAAGCPLPVPADVEPGLPHEWAHFLRTPAVGLRPGAPIVVRVGPLSERGADGRTGLIALTPYELIIAREPLPEVLGGAWPCTPDVLAVPRQRLVGAEHSGEGATLRVDGSDLDVPLPRSLADVVCALARRARSG
jgi:hypothetical protein